LPFVRKPWPLSLGTQCAVRKPHIGEQVRRRPRNVLPADPP